MYPDNTSIYQGPDEPWQKPFYIVVALHIGFALIVAFGPIFSQQTPRFENIYTVDLIELPSPSQSAPAPQQQSKSEPTPAPQKIEAEPTPKKVVVPEPEVVKEEVVPEPEVVKEEVVPDTPPEEPVVPVEDIKAISIAPNKKKVKKEIKPETVEKKKPVEEKINKNKAVEARKRLAESLKEEAKAQQLAEQALRDLENERNLFKSSTTPTTTQSENKSASTSSNTGNTSGNNSNSAAMNSVEAQWLATVNSHILRFWALPEFKQWDPELTATIIITVDKNGTIIDYFFENASNDKVFDQFVKKALQDANPLPKIPAALNKQRFELGLHFKPGTIQ